MKTFHQILDELAMKKAEIYYDISPTNFGADITTFGKNKYVFWFNAVYDNSTYFLKSLNDAFMKSLYYYGDIDFGIWEIYFQDEEGNYDVSKKESGISLQLFSALETIIKKFIREMKPEAFYFTGYMSETSRIKLYKFLAKKINRATKKYFYYSFKEANEIYFAFLPKETEEIYKKFKDNKL